MSPLIFRFSTFSRGWDQHGPTCVAAAQKFQSVLDCWTEDQFTVTVSTGIRNRENRVSEIVVRELKRAKTVSWWCVQTREVWSIEDEHETHMCPGHFWICEFGMVPGSNMTCVEKKFDL